MRKTLRSSISLDKKDVLPPPSPDNHSFCAAKPPSPDNKPVFLFELQITFPFSVARYPHCCFFLSPKKPQNPRDWLLPVAPGSDKGGIIVRQSELLKSPELGRAAGTALGWVGWRGLEAWRVKWVLPAQGVLFEGFQILKTTNKHPLEGAGR